MKIENRGQGLTFECRVTTRTSRSAVRGTRDGVLLLSLAAPPVDGKANDELIRFLSGILDVPKSRIKILRGERAKTKLVFVVGITREKAAEILTPISPAPPSR